MTSPIQLTVGSAPFSGLNGAVAALSLEPFMDGAMPHLCTRRLPVVPADVDLVPGGAQVLRSVVADQTRDVLVGGDGWRARIIHFEGTGKGWVEVCALDAALATSVADDIASRCPGAEPEVEGVEVTVWNYGGNGITNRREHRVHSSAWSDIDANYPADVRASLADLVAFTPIADGAGRVAVLHGEPGTGKTTFLRSLLWEWRSWADGQIVMDSEIFVDSATYLTEVSAREPEPGRWNVVVLEDAGGLIDEDQPFGGDLGKLLNMSDGIVGMGTRTLYLLTTNERIRTVHPALVRPGRCFANIEFRAFSRSEAARWLGVPPDDVPFDGYALAELFERRGDSPLITNITEPAAHGVYL